MCIRIPNSDRIVRYRVPHVPREIPIAAGLKELVFAYHALERRAGVEFGGDLGHGGLVAEFGALGQRLSNG